MYKRKRVVAYSDFFRVAWIIIGLECFLIGGVLGYILKTHIIEMDYETVTIEKIHRV